jgi:glycosidase
MFQWIERFMSRYNPRYYFAIETSYGSTADLKEMIDELHKNGIRVIMDGVSQSKQQTHHVLICTYVHVCQGLQSCGFFVAIDTDRS